MVFVMANLISYYAISSKNATMASLIEISYPVFTAFFAFAIFKEIQFNITSLIGAFFIFAGVILVFVGSK